MKILCVDDEPEILELLGQFLDLLGHNVVLANNGQEGWQIFSASPDSFDALITDERMPNLSGLGLVKLVRAKGYELPVIITSGHMDDDMDKTATDFKVNAILSKPFSLAEFQEVLTTLQK